jgi:hypothetical protein
MGGETAPHLIISERVPVIRPGKKHLLRTNWFPRLPDFYQL